MGTAHLWLPEDVTADELAFDGGAAPAAADAGPREPGWQRIDAKRALRLHGRGSLDGPAAVKAALAACDRTAREVQDIAARMSESPTRDASANSGAPSRGELAAKSVTARGIARAACAVAAVRVALGGSRPEDQARLDAAGARWRAPH
jgi:hypothetical protein